MANDELVIFINEMLSASSESDLPSTAPIFRVHDRLRCTNEAAYDPTVIAIGPLHHKDNQLIKMDCLKRMYLKQILQSKDDKWINKCQQVIRDSEEKARACYAEVIELSKIQFEKMLLLDAIFIIGFLRQYNQVFYGGGIPVSENDPIFNNSNRVKHVLRDLLLLENQIPLFILQRLFELLRDGDGEISDLIQPLVLFKDEFPRGITSPLPDVDHLLGLVHHVHCSYFARTRNSATGVEEGNEEMTIFEEGGPYGSAEITSPATEAEEEGGTCGIEEITNLTTKVDKGGTHVSKEITSPTTKVEEEGSTCGIEEITSLNAEVEGEHDPHVSVEIRRPTTGMEEGDAQVSVEITSPTVKVEEEGNFHVKAEVTSHATEVEEEGGTCGIKEVANCVIEVEEGNAHVSVEIKSTATEVEEGSMEMTSLEEGGDVMSSPFAEAEKSCNYGIEVNLDIEEGGDPGIVGIKEFINSATEMAKVGIRFKMPMDDQITSWLDIKYRHGKVYIPKFEISDDTEYWFRNMIAYEYDRLCKHPKYVTDYALTMQCLIQSPEDVRLLRHRGIISNWLGGDEKVSTLFRNLVSDIGRRRVNFTYRDVFDRANRWKRTTTWLITLFSRIHFIDPWKIVSLIVITILLLTGALELWQVRI